MKKKVIELTVMMPQDEEHRLAGAPESLPTTFLYFDADWMWMPALWRSGALEIEKVFKDRIERDIYDMARVTSFRVVTPISEVKKEEEEKSEFERKMRESMNKKEKA